MKKFLFGITAVSLFILTAGTVMAFIANTGSYYDFDLPDGQNWIIYTHDVEGNIYGSATKDTAEVVPSAYFYPDDSPEDAGYPVIATVPPEQEFYLTIVFRGASGADRSYLRVPEVFDPLHTNTWNDLMFSEPYPYPWDADSIVEVTYPEDPAIGENIDDGLNKPGGYYTWEKPTVFVFNEEGYWHFSTQTRYTEDYTRYAFSIHVAPLIKTKADVLLESGVPGEGLENAPGLQKPFNPKSQAAEHAGKK